MPTQREKTQALASHLLDDLILLREKYAILDPMLFDPGVAEAWGKGRRARGFYALQKALFLSCAQDLAKIALDRDERAPSIFNIVTRLESEELRSELRESFAVWRLHFVDDDPVVTQMLTRMELEEEAERRQQFDQLYSDLMKNWDNLQRSSVVTGFKAIRDKVIAHTEVRYHVDRYKRVDLGSLGLKWRDLGDCIGLLQVIVEQMGLIVRNAAFTWDMLDDQLSSAAKSFWMVPPDARGSQEV